MHQIATKIREDVSESVATYPDYEQAKAAISRLESNDFPTQFAAISADGISLKPQRRGVHFLATLILTTLGTVVAATTVFYLMQNLAPASAFMGVMTTGIIAGIIFGIITFFSLVDPKEDRTNPLFRAKYFDIIVHGQYSAAARGFLKPEPEPEAPREEPQAQRVS